MSAILFGYLQTSTIQMLKAILGFVMLLLVFGSRNATTASASAYAAVLSRELRTYILYRCKYCAVNLIQTVSYYTGTGQKYEKHRRFTGSVISRSK